MSKISIIIKTGKMECRQQFEGLARLTWIAAMTLEHGILEANAATGKAIVMTGKNAPIVIDWNIVLGLEQLKMRAAN